MQIKPETEEEQFLIADALLSAALGLDEDAVADERRGRLETATRNRMDADLLRKWHDEVEDMEV